MTSRTRDSTAVSRWSVSLLAVSFIITIPEVVRERTRVASSVPAIEGASHLRATPVYFTLFVPTFEGLLAE
jgi:hypothetical protein